MERARLTYFEMRGRAEAIRLLLHATDARFDDHRVAVREEWEALKPTLPFGGLPTYRSNGALLCESHAILRYLGRALLPPVREPSDLAELDIGQEALAEAQEDLWRFNWRRSYYDHLESYAEETLEPRLHRLRSWLRRPRSGSREWFGAAFSHVDCLAFCFLDEVDAFFPAVHGRFTELVELHARVASLPGIAKYLASRNRPAVFGMGSLGPKVDPRAAVRPDTLFTNPWTEPIDLLQALERQRRLTSDPG